MSRAWLNAVLHGLLGDLVEGDASDLFALFGAGAELDREMIGDGFAFAIGVRREIDLVGLGGRLFQLVDDFFFAGRHDQLRLEGALLQLDANVVFGQVHDMSDGSADLKPFAQILLDRLRLRRRFDDHQ